MKVHCRCYIYEMYYLFEAAINSDKTGRDHI